MAKNIPTQRVFLKDCYTSSIDGLRAYTHNGSEKLVFNSGKRYYIYI